MSKPTVLGLITARGGSKGLPGKHLLPLHGKPVIAWTVEAALRSVVDRVVVSTDDPGIAACCRQYGADVSFMRPAELAQDNSGHMDVVLHALDWLEREQKYRADYLLLLQPTSPLRTTVDIDASIDLIVKRGADGVLGVCETHHHPYLIRKVSPDGWIRDFMPGVPPPGSAERRRQDLPAAYFDNGAIYLTRTHVLRAQHNFIPEFTVPYIMPSNRSIQLDTMWDYKLMQWTIDRLFPDTESLSPPP